ncbi:MAG: hypothetical protein GY886_12280 [Gammaproteobacteria bacterium]|nr:hypothetical protein [Gammaproteobacteria bacterium]
MTATSSIPAGLEADSGAAFAWAIKKALQQTDDMLPVEVLAHDRAAGTVTVKHYITIVLTDGTQTTRPNEIEVPVITMGGGGFMMSFDLPVGSTGFIKALDRDWALFLQSYEESPPDTARFHSFSSGVFIPSVMQGWTIAEEDKAAMVIQSLDGTIKVSLSDDTVKIKHPKQIDLSAPKIMMNGVDYFAHWHGYIDSKGAAATPTASQTVEPDTPAIP